MYTARVNGIMGIHRMSSAVRMEDLANMVTGSTMKLPPSNKASIGFWSRLWSSVNCYGASSFKILDIFLAAF